MRQRGVTWGLFLLWQLLVAAGFAVSFGMTPPKERMLLARTLSDVPPVPPLPVPRSRPLVVASLYDRPDLVRDEELAAVLERLLPRFSPHRTKPNFVEHAVRIWGVTIEFDDPQAMSGPDMQQFLTDHARYAAAWGEGVAPLVQERSSGVSIRWGRETGASVHHDHWLASLTEGGVALDTPVYGPARRGSTIRSVLEESLRDLRLDERETEWTAMAFGLWLPPTRTWTGSEGRQFSFDLIARRLLRGHKELGVCSGTHRVYSLALVLRLDDEFDILSADVRACIEAHLHEVRRLLMAAQFADGRWPSNWPDGDRAAANRPSDELYKQVIATGHHLEWLALAPQEFHPPDEQIRRAIRWVIDTTTACTAAEILPHYTFYSHVGNALALWRHTSPAVFWSAWQAEHSYVATPVNTVDLGAWTGETGSPDSE